MCQGSTSETRKQTKVSKQSKHKERCASRFDETRCAVNLRLNYDDFDYLIENLLCIMHRHSEASNQFLITASKLEVLVAVIILHLCESRCKKEIDAHCLEFKFIIEGLLKLADNKIFDK